MTRLQAVQTINTAMQWWEDYRIKNAPSIWGRIWLEFKRFLGYLSFDLEYLTQVSKSVNSQDMFIANRWGMALESKTAGNRIACWQLLELESQAMSRALVEYNVPRTMLEEIAEIRIELAKVGKGINESYQPVIRERIIGKPQRQFKPDNAWVYYIFASQHGLLTGEQTQSPQQLLDKPLTGRQLEKYIEKFIALLKQMADDLK